VPEVVVDGVTGVVCDDAADLPAAIHAARQLSPAHCREHVRSRFDVATMTAGYEALYRDALAARRPARRSAVVVPVPVPRPSVLEPAVAEAVA
jgi:hypothetical protein